MLKKVNIAFTYSLLLPNWSWSSPCFCSKGSFCLKWLSFHDLSQWNPWHPAWPRSSALFFTKLALNFLWFSKGQWQKTCEHISGMRKLDRREVCYLTLWRESFLGTWAIAKYYRCQDSLEEAEAKSKDKDVDRKGVPGKQMWIWNMVVLCIRHVTLVSEGGLGAP